MSTHGEPNPRASYVIFSDAFSHNSGLFLEGMLDLQSGPLSAMASRRSWLRRPARINRQVPPSVCAVSPASSTSHRAVYRSAWYHNSASTKRKAGNPANVAARIVLTESQSLVAHNSSTFPGPNRWRPRSNAFNSEANLLAFTFRPSGSPSVGR